MTKGELIHIYLKIYNEWCNFGTFNKEITNISNEKIVNNRLKKKEGLSILIN